MMLTDIQISKADLKIRGHYERYYDKSTAAEEEVNQKLFKLYRIRCTTMQIL